MAEGKLDRIKSIARKPLTRAVLTGAAIGTAIGGLAPIPNSSQAASHESPKPTAALVDEAKTPSPTLEAQPIKTATPTMSPEPTPTTTPKPTPEPTRAPIVGAVAPRETPPAKIEIFNKDGEISYNSFFYFGDKIKPADKDIVIKEMLDKPSTISIDRSDVHAYQPSKGNEFFVVGPDGTKYASVKLSDGDPILLNPEQYADFLNKGWVGGHTGRMDRYSDYLSFWLMKGSKINVEVVNLPRPDGATRPVLVFKGITIPEVDPARPTDFMTKEGGISYDKFFNAKDIKSSILHEMLNEMVGKDISILVDKYDKYRRPGVYSTSPEDDFIASDGKSYKEVSLWAGETTVHLLLTPEQYESFKRSGWNLGSREEHKGTPATSNFPASRPYFTETLPLGSTIKGKISGDTDQFGRVYLFFQGIEIPSNPKPNPNLN